MKLCLSCGSAFQSENWQCPICHFAPEEQNGFTRLIRGAREENIQIDTKALERRAQLKAESFWFRSRNKLIVECLQKFFPKATSFLEVGCGNGFILSEVAQQFQSLSVSGSDISAKNLTFAAGKISRAHFFQMDALEMPFESEFDLIGIFDVLEHIELDDMVLRQLYKSLKPGGGVIITVPQHRFLWSERDELLGHLRRYSRVELRKRLETAGFKNLFTTSFVSLLLPAMIASRVFVRFRSKEDAAKESTVPAPLNSVFQTVLDIERSLINFGLCLPAGGSLLAIGQKP